MSVQRGDDTSIAKHSEILEYRAEFTHWFGYFVPLTLKFRVALGMLRLKKIRSRVMIGVGMLSQSTMRDIC
jgi:hypothetical protein